MSLDFDLTRLDEAKRAEVFPPDEDGKMHNALHTLIWATMPVGIGAITSQNAEGFWHRMDIWQKAIGPQFQVWTPNPMGAAAFPPGTPESDMGEWKPLYITKEQVFAAIGLHTNASPKTKTQFLKDLYETHERFQ